MANTSPLPLAGDGSARFLPWLVALMVFLAAIAIAAAAVIGSGLERWDNSLLGTLTVQLPPAASASPGDTVNSLASDKIQAAIGVIRRSPGVIDATPLDAGEMARLLLPWLGQIDPAQLPLPVLIDLHVVPGQFDAAALEKQLGAIAPGAVVQEHAAWLDRFFKAARLIEAVAAAIVLLIGAVAAAAVVFTTRTGLTLYAALIDLLHLMGATDSYIARQFQLHAFRLVVKGGLIGLVMTLLAFGGFRLALENGGNAADSIFLPGFHLPLEAVLAVALLPLLMGLVGLLTARITVLRVLGRMP